MLSRNNVAMVSDFGLSRDVYESGIYDHTSGVGKWMFLIVGGFSCSLDQLLCLIWVKLNAVDSLFKDAEYRKLSLERSPKFNLREGQKYRSYSLLGAWGLGQLGADDAASFPVCHDEQISNLQQNFTMFRAKIQVNDPWQISDVHDFLTWTVITYYFSLFFLFLFCF